MDEMEDSQVKGKYGVPKIAIQIHVVFMGNMANANMGFLKDVISCVRPNKQLYCTFFQNEAVWLSHESPSEHSSFVESSHTHIILVLQKLLFSLVLRMIQPSTHCRCVSLVSCGVFLALCVNQRNRQAIGHMSVSFLHRCSISDAGMETELPHISHAALPSRTRADGYADACRTIWLQHNTT